MFDFQEICLETWWVLDTTYVHKKWHQDPPIIKISFEFLNIILRKPIQMYNHRTLQNNNSIEITT
jgi:hypothetical protein